MKETKTKKQDVRFYNSLTRRVEPFSALAGDLVKIYACGPTVYDEPHLGNYRSFLAVDLLNRVLRFNGYSVFLVLNITDVGHLTSDQDYGEDKVEKSARVKKMTAQEVALSNEKKFKEGLKALNIILPAKMPRASEHIQEMIKTIKKIEAAGFAYKIDDGIYFDTSKDKSYGELGRLNLEGLKEGARVKKSFQKRNPSDFALWKFSYPQGRDFNPKIDKPESRRQMEWESPWGVGFPGWHIECSSMSEKYLGVPFDIHTGGVEHIPIHHTNELAQTRAAYGCRLANYFIHFEHLLLDGKRMGKSKGNSVYLRDIAKRELSLSAFRYLCLSSHYRDRLNFTWDSLKSAQNTVNNILRQMEREGSRDLKAKEEALKIINNDLASPAFLAYLHKKKNPWLWKEFSAILGLNFSSKPKKIPSKIFSLLKQRNSLRAEGKFKESDKIRRRIEEQGYIVKDSSKGSELDFKDFS